jgi:hypothetical protein
MRKIGLITFAALLTVACNNSANETTATDSTTTKDNTNVYDTGAGSSMTDTSHRPDTTPLPNKTQDTGTKK